MEDPPPFRLRKTVAWPSSNPWVLTWKTRPGTTNWHNYQTQDAAIRGMNRVIFRNTREDVDS